MLAIGGLGRWRDLFFAMRYEVIKVLDIIEYMFYNIRGIIQEVGKFVKFGLDRYNCLLF